MSKRIAIIGGGISGLAALHYLNKKYAQRDDIDISLFESNDYSGGTILSKKRNGCLFEVGPNGFFGSSLQTLSLVDDLNLNDELIAAREESNKKFIALGNKLHEVPNHPWKLLKTGLLSLVGKARVFGEIFVPKGGFEDETVYGFAQRRFGVQFAEHVIDPMVSGVFGGDAKKLVLKAAFPKIFDLENQYGSLFKAVKQLRTTDKGNDAGMPKGTLHSFEEGMSKLTYTIYQKYKEQIQMGQDVKTITYDLKQYVVHMQKEHSVVNAVFICTPAYVTAEILKSLNAHVSENLREIPYAPMAVVGLVYPKKSFKRMPEGFGFLIPSKEGKIVLGVLYESQIFENRCPSDLILLRVMLGGAHHNEIIALNEDQIVELAIKEVEERFAVHGPIKDIFFKKWDKAIPQYDKRCVEVTRDIKDDLKEFPNIHLVANYLNGISTNDCIENAYKAVQDFHV